jgi:hypothetical protein
MVQADDLTRFVGGRTSPRAVAEVIKGSTDGADSRATDTVQEKTSATVSLVPLRSSCRWPAAANSCSSGGRATDHAAF